MDAWSNAHSVGRDLPDTYNIAVLDMLQFKQEMGLDKAVGLIQRDSMCVPAYILFSGLVALGGNPKLAKQYLPRKIKSQEFKGECEVELVVNRREVVHLQAIDCWISGDFAKACDLWESILVEHPFDIIALKFVQTACFFLGLSKRLLDSIAQVFPLWEQEKPYGYGYVFGMFSFALEENGEFQRSENYAREGLNLNGGNDIWSIHALSHIYLESGRYSEGIELLNKTENDWKNQLGLSCHVYWHKALFYLETNQTAEALLLFDEHILPLVKISNGFPLDVSDASSLLWRLELLDVNVDDRWSSLDVFVDAHLDDKFYIFNDSHFMFNLCRRYSLEENKNLAEFHIDRLSSNSKDIDNWNNIVTQEVGLDVCRSILSFYRHDYSNCFTLLYSKRYLLTRIGGSNAQRDIFNLTILKSALRSNNFSIANALLTQRQCIHPNTTKSFINQSIKKLIKK
jgi:tetratricopeptide (TPR) repeat protein